MLYLKKLRQLSTLSSVLLCFSMAVSLGTATSSAAKAKQLKQTNVQIEELEPPANSVDESIDFYNSIVRVIQNMPSNGQPRDISVEDNNSQRLSEQQLNDSLEVYQIIGRLLKEGKLSPSAYSALPFIQDFNLPFYQGTLVAIAETNLAAIPEEQLIASNACLEIAKEGEEITNLRMEAGVGTRIDILIARYLRRHCQIQRLELEIAQSDIELESLQESIDLAESKSEIAEARQNPKVPDFLANYYINNIELLQKLNSQGKSLEIQTDDSVLQRLYKQQLNDALDLYRLVGIRLGTGIMGDESRIGMIVLPAVLISLAEVNLATEPNGQELAARTCLEIAQAWKEYISPTEEVTSETDVEALNADYWKKQCDIRKLQTDKLQP